MWCFTVIDHHEEYENLLVFVSAYTIFTGKGSVPAFIHCQDGFYELRRKINEYFAPVHVENENDVEKMASIVKKNKWFFIQVDTCSYNG